MANNTLLASDNFASGSLAAGWSAWPGQSESQIVNLPPHVAEPNLLSTPAGQIWTGLTWPADQISEVTINSIVQESVTSVYMRVRGISSPVNAYQVNWTSTAGAGTGVATIYRIDAGAATSLASVGSLTYAAGDILTVSVVGSCISAYQNGIRRIYWYDSTYTSGSPGFSTVAATNVNHVQISAWRGYSAEQQDGVWKKKGIVIPAISADLPYGAANPSNILYEGNAQILSGTVYKVWFTSWSANAVGYAESSDGISWTRHSGAVLAGHFCGGVFKNGSTYYMYAFVSGTGSCDVFTSTDGVTWGSAVATNIAPGTQYYFQPFAIVGGTWYAIASGATLYTSTNGTTWTSSGATGLTGVTAGGITQVGSNWYAWVQHAPPGNTPDGTETLRYKCNNPGTFTSWSLDTHSAHISQMYEAVNSFAGQSIPGGLIQVGSQTYMYSTQCPGDIGTPAIYQIGLSIAPATLLQLVGSPEDAMPQVASDPFAGGSGSLGANWTDGTNALKVVSGPFVEPTVTSTACWDFYSGASFGDNQWSEVPIHLIGSGDLIAPFVRGFGFTWYECLITGGPPATVQIRSRNVGTAVNIGPSQTVAITAGDKIRVEVFNGPDGFPVITAFQNGYCVLQVQDYTSLIPSGGKPGIYMATFSGSLANTQISAWAGGNASVIPSYPTSTAGQVGAFLVGP